MNSLRLLRPALLSALLAAAFVSPAWAQDEYEQGSRRRNARSIDDADDESLDAPVKRKRTRRHAAPIDEEEYEPVAREPEPEPMPARRTVDYDELPRATDRSLPAAEPTRRAADEGFRDLPDAPEDGPAPRTRTAEEDLGDGVPQDDVRLALIDEPGNGFAVELVGGALMLDSAIGELQPTPTFAGGIHATWQLGRVFRPENDFLHRGLWLDVSYLYTGGSGGTRDVSVASSYHHVSAAALVGAPLELKGLQMLFYGKAGPAMFIMPFRYSIQGVDTDFTGVRGGLAYGAGIRGVYYFGKVGIAARVELLRYRRSYLDDSMRGGGLGVAF